jgi:hypothetical protein
MTTDKFYNKDGTLTGYAFACGYLEVYGESRDSKNRLRIYREPNDWHVKGWIGEDGKTHVWEIFEKLSDARKFCRKHYKLVK